MGGESEELRPALPVEPMDAAQAEIGLVDDRGGFERVVPALPAELSPRNALELFVDQRQDLRLGLAIARGPPLEPFGDGLFLG
jgi:hypothetical protein